jgi:hypothetical protein
MAKKVAQAAAEQNISGTSFLHHYREVDDAEKKQKTASGHVGEKKKKAKGEGVNLPAFALFRKLERMDADDALKLLKDAARYCIYRKLPFGAQLSFLVDDKVDPISAKERAKQDDHDATQQGIDARSNKEPRENNPYKDQPGSPAYAAWDMGWNQRDETIAAVGDEKVAAPRGRRGAGAESRPN